MPREWDATKFSSGNLMTGIYDFTAQTSDGFPVDDKCTLIIMRPSRYFQTALLFFEGNDDTNSTRVWG